VLELLCLAKEFDLEKKKMAAAESEPPSDLSNSDVVSKYREAGMCTTGHGGGGGAGFLCVTD
jgi:hypothetical protein